MKTIWSDPGLECRTGVGSQARAEVPCVSHGASYLPDAELDVPTKPLTETLIRRNRILADLIFMCWAFLTVILGIIMKKQMSAHYFEKAGFSSITEL